MPQLYSYIRWSTDRQDKGTTRNRQLAAAKAYADENGLEMVEILEPGVSAFRGKNRTEKLGGFIDAVKNNAIPSDSYLYCENLDRISRDQVDKALSLFLELIGLGLTIITGMDRKVYNRDTIRQNPTDLMISILMFIRGNEESETKSNRTVGNVVALVERHKEGLPVNIKSVGRHPFWIDDTGSQYEAVKKHPFYWNIAREIIDMFLSGNGVYSVKKYLDEKYPNGLKGREWDYQVLKKMRDNRALIGERTINLRGVPYKLENYYPWLCKDEAEFFLLEKRKQQNNYKSKKEGADTIKLLSGLSILRCSKCGGTMHSFMNHGKARYICTNGVHLQKNCSGWSITAQLVEHCTMIALLIGYMDKSRKNGSDTTLIEEELNEKEKFIKALDSKISNLVTAIAIAPDVNSLAHSLNEINSKRKELVLSVEKLKERLVSFQGKGSFEVDIMEFLILIQWAVITNMEDNDRDKIRKIIDAIIEYIVVDKTNDCITIKIKYYGNDEVLVFGGVDRKPHWRFSIDFDTGKEGALTVLENDLKDVPEIQKAVSYLHKLEKGYLAMYDSAVTMLAEVGYPEIKGTQFWPNTGKHEKVTVAFDGVEHTISFNGRLPKAIASAIEKTGLTRQQFIEKFKIQ
ncbi:recombinase family protein [Klebsiella pneumoniae]|uniref:recombinase family protein n=1 Tax=Klebsiella pneumoniae TaxID=573 RepID=UPI0021D86737|nr:recombinase family protein [Klebsiella pneumoniae]MCU8611316.1 recombinase family protein [Klebsiella pneumoniae]